jgi:hypothetical protein
MWRTIMSKGYKRLGLWMVAAMASVLVACAVEDGEVASDETATVEKASTVTGDELSTIFLTRDADDEVALAAAPCRRVTAASIPAYSTATSGTVNCRFLRGDTISYIAVSNGRFLTWCPRHTPPSQGVFSWGTLSGTIEVTCPW